MGTSGYQGAVETSNVELSYGLETVWGQAPTTTFQAVRFTGEGFKGKKDRRRPEEINDFAQVSAAVTTQESADGSLNFAMSFGTHDDLWCSLLNSSWGAQLNIAGASGDISFVASGNKITSTTANKFQNVQLRQWIKVKGCGPVGPAGNGPSFYVQVWSKPDNQTILVVGKTLVDETPAAAAVTIKGSMIRNSNLVQTLFMQKKLGSAGYLTYPGTFLTGGSINAQQGQFTSGSFNALSKQEVKAVGDSSTGGVMPAPTGQVIDNVAGFQGLLLDGAVVAATVRALNLNFQKEGAAAYYGMGATGAEGMIRGDLSATGTAEIYFKTFDLYDRYRNEATGPLSFRQVDAAGQAYVLTVLNGFLNNPEVVAGGRNQPVVAKFEVEGNPDPVTGKTFQLDRLAA
ncbi:phage tail tube protein [Azospirillum himalayense]|uniref:Phage tail tube protein n=1 Tax=Azospirillum himalayense TaxID=654847 RepID=A0ABW0GAF8_9PROT